MTGDGIPLLLAAIGDRLRKKKVRGSIRLRPDQGRERALLFEMGAVTNEYEIEDGGSVLELKLLDRDLRRFLKREKLDSEFIEHSEVYKSPNTATQR